MYEMGVIEQMRHEKGFSNTHAHTHKMIPRPAPQVQLQLCDIIERASSSHDAVHVNDP